MRGGCPVDFIGEQNIGEDGAFAEGERAVARIVETAPGHIGGKQVRRKLNPLKLTVNGFGEGFRQRRLPRSRHIFQQGMSARQQRIEQEADSLRLALNDPSQVGFDSMDPRGELSGRKRAYGMVGGTGRIGRRSRAGRQNRVRGRWR